MVYINIHHSRYIIPNNNNIYKISTNYDYIIDENNTKLFRIFDMPDKCLLYHIELNKILNELVIYIKIDIDILKKMVLNGKYLPSRNILFNLLRKDKNNQHLILNIIDTLNKPITYKSTPNILNTNLNIKLYNYQNENNKWMLNVENNQCTYEYLDNNIVKLDDLYINLEKERFIFNYKYNKLKFKGGALIDSPGLGKCHLPDTYIYINKTLIKSENIWNQHATNITVTNNEEISECDNLYINSYNEQSKQIEIQPIKTLYRQTINENIKKITLSNGFNICITQNHKLYTSSGWTSDLQINDEVAINTIFKQPIEITHNINLIKLIALKELKLLIILKNKFYIICKKPNYIKEFGFIIENYFKQIQPLVNYNFSIQKTKTHSKLEYKNLQINKIEQYSLDNILESSKENQLHFIQFIIKITNNKFYSSSYKKLLEIDIISRSNNKYLEIKNIRNTYYIGTFRELTDNPLQIFKIINIENINYCGYVYDYYIEKEHNYIANNMLCHNTICMISLCELN